MATQDPPIEVDRVACEVCLREVPRSEATVPEATDYVVYFCGLECYEKWKHLPDKPDVRAEETKV
jgi:Domain of unknown function (DUF3330)